MKSAAPTNINELRNEAEYWAQATHTVTGPTLAKMLFNAADEIERLRGALEYYACPSDCKQERLKDGNCIRSLAGDCGETARDALTPRNSSR